jgi:hypothetical protein
MTDEEWTERLRAFDQCREAHARTLETFRAQVEAARRTLSRVVLQLSAERAAIGAPIVHKPRLMRSWRTRAQRPESRMQARAGRPRLREFTEDGERWSVWETIPAKPALFVTGEVDRGGRQGRSTGEVDRRAAGWLTFMAGAEKRRYSPVPVGWQNWSDDRLRHLLREAEAPVRGRRVRGW